MECIKCGQGNAATTTYCSSCGARLDYTLEEVRRHVDQKREREQESERRFFAGRILIFAVALFLLALSVSFMAGSPPAVPTMPSITAGMTSCRVDYRFTPPVIDGMIPLEEK